MIGGEEFDCSTDGCRPGPVEPSSLTRTPIRRCIGCRDVLILWDEDDTDDTE